MNIFRVVTPRLRKFSTFSFAIEFLTPSKRIGMNIILIVSDTFRYDNLFDRAEAMPVRTPNLDRFSERAVSLEKLYMSSFPTIPHHKFLSVRERQESAPSDQDWRPAWPFPLTHHRLGLIAPGSIPRSLLRTFNFEIWKLKCLGACPEDLYLFLRLRYILSLPMPPPPITP